MILIVDNYDSFTYNLVQYVGAINPNLKVVRNDEVTSENIEEWGVTHIIMSPGPGRPVDAGACIDIIKDCGSTTPILGVCLGHQAICEAYGATITYAKDLVHGKSAKVEVTQDTTLFKGMDPVIMAARYHSLAADPTTMPEDLTITARAEDGEIMAVQHATHPVYGVQFHPESIMTPQGATIIKNFLES
ncbi:MAG: aminodeoxychorismate/anthranilate synthase component II [Actinomycetaceae bacterium]|nr:aminodeoxychorismate/anthranilate synthase component II [Actinomycetaceae bacterium]